MPPKNRPESSDHSGDTPSTPTVPAGLAEELEEIIPLMTRTELIRIVDVAVKAALAAQQRRVEQPQSVPPASPVSALEQYRANRLVKPQPMQTSGSGSKRKWTGSSNSSPMFQKKKSNNPSNRTFSVSSQTRMNRQRRELIRQNSSQLSSPTTKVQCFNCRQYGHYQRDCPQPKRPRTGGSSVIPSALPILTIAPQPTETQGNQSSMPTPSLQTQTLAPSASNMKEHSDSMKGIVTTPCIP